MIHKRQTILTHDPEGSSDNDDLMAFSNMRSLIEDHPDGDIPISSVLIVMMPGELFIEMQCPNEITVAVEPGDKLNDIGGTKVEGATEIGSVHDHDGGHGPSCPDDCPANITQRSKR